jgi:peptidoglycan hydrolase-like protein with peptidoglycan-binding domain
MNSSTLEDRLKAALTARAELVTQDALRAELSAPGRRRPPPRSLNIALPLTAAAALASLVVTATLARQPEQQRLSPAQAGASASHALRPVPATPPRPSGPDPAPPAVPTLRSTAPVVEPAEVGIDLAAYPVLTPGARAPAVRVAQRLLRDLDYDTGPIDGVFGPRTVAALERFRRGHALPDRKALGNADWAALLSAGSRPLLEPGSVGEDVRRLQRALTAALRRTVRIDGIYGAETESAVRAYQRLTGIEVDGAAGAAVWSGLGGARVQAQPRPDAEPSPPVTDSMPSGQPGDVSPTPGPTPSSTPDPLPSGTSSPSAADSTRATPSTGSQTGENGGA